MRHKATIKYLGVNLNNPSFTNSTTRWIVLFFNILPFANNKIFLISQRYWNRRFAIPGFWPGFVKCARSMENWFFPSSDVTRALKNGVEKFWGPVWHHLMWKTGKTCLRLPKPGNSIPSISIMLPLAKYLPK